MDSRLGMLMALAFALAGCVTVSNTLSREQAVNLRVAAVNVGFAPDARIAWGDGERAYAATRGLPAYESNQVANTPEAQSYIRNVVGSKMKAAMERHLSQRLRGSNAVRVEVTIMEVNIASAVQRVLIGGAHTMKADVTLIDAKTGAVLVAYPAQSATGMAGQGIGGVLIDHALFAEPIDRLADRYASQYGYWLVPNSGPSHPSGT